ncbi:MAG: PAS domain-containing protein [Candidatus Latescibacterota bacterium]
MTSDSQLRPGRSEGLPAGSDLDWHRLLAALPMPATLLDRDGIILDINPAFLEMAGPYGCAAPPTVSQVRTELTCC